jgi:hypothetical protein
MNRNMAMKIESINWGNKTLPPELSTLLRSGFREGEGCIFLASLAGSTNASLSNFPDRTGYECFINSIHVDDYVQNDYLLYACLFVEGLFNAWSYRNATSPISAIISCDDLGATVKFHLTRKGESWISEELEKYEEAILVADSSLMFLRQLKHASHS